MKTTALLSGRRFDRYAALPWLAGVLALTLYTLTAAPGITWAHEGADGGDLITAAMTWGVPHPSGYPTYCLLGRLFALLPLGTPARRFVLFSAVTMALGIGLACWAAKRVLQRIYPTAESVTNALAFSAALVLATSPLLWSQAIIAEVYALHSLFVALALSQALRFDKASPSRAWLALGLTLGLGLGNHLTLIGLIPALAVWLWPWATRRRVICGLMGLGLGLSVYAYLPLAARAESPVNWGEAHTWQGFWWLLSGRLYRRYLWTVPLGYLPQRLLALIGLLARQFSPLGLPLAGVGWVSWWRAGSDLRRLAKALLLSGVIWCAYALGYNTTDSYLYILPCLFLMAPILASGAHAIAFLLERRFPLFVLPALLMVSACWSLVQNTPSLSLRNDSEAIDWVETTLRALPSQSLVITGDDRHTFALAYALWAEGHRPDLLLVDGELWAEPWYARQVAQRAPDLARNAASLGDLVQQAFNLGRPVCLTDPRPEIESRYPFEAHGSVLCASASAIGLQ